MDAMDQDIGKGVGILISMRVDRKAYQNRLTLKGKDAVRIANTLYDLVTGKIVGGNYHWLAVRFSVFND